VTPLKVAVVIPTRNRADLVEFALASVMSGRPDSVGVVVSDNSTEDREVDATSAASEKYDPSVVCYIRPPEPLDMAAHWQWALDRALDDGTATHVAFLTDRMVFRPGALSSVVGMVGQNPDRVLTYATASIDDAQVPVRLRFPEWSGRLLELRSIRMLELASRSLTPRAAPRGLNSVVPRATFDAVRDEFGSVFLSYSPDLTFAFRCLAVVDSILHYDCPVLIGYAARRSNGMAYGRGERSGELAKFLSELGTATPHHAAPVPAFEVSSNGFAHEYNLVRNQTTHPEKFPPLDYDAYLETIERDLQHIRNKDVADAMTALFSEVASPGFRRPRSLRILRRYAARLIDDPAVSVRIGAARLRSRLLAAAPTRPVWERLGRRGIRPPATQWFHFRDTDEALAFALKYPRRRMRTSSELEMVLRGG